MKMISYRCQLCSRTHYSREGLKPGYCTTCGPRGLLIQNINWARVTRVMTDAFNEGTKAFRNLAKAMNKAANTINNSFND